MTSRTKGDSKSPFQGARAHLALAALEPRRQEAVKRYFDGEPIERICQEMGCSKSWLYKWKNRYQVTEPDWSQARSRRPETIPTKTPVAVELEIVRLSQTLSPEKSETVSARVIRDHLGEHEGASRPSIRTIYRILNRHTKEVHSHSMTS
jgi:transposase